MKLSHITLKFILLEDATKPSCVIQSYGTPNYSIHRATNNLIYGVSFWNGPTVFGLMNTKSSIMKIGKCFRYCFYYLADES